MLYEQLYCMNEKELNAAIAGITGQDLEYSTDIAAAWTLVDLMLAKGEYFMLVSPSPFGSSKVWEVSLSRFLQDDTEITGVRAALALARAFYFCSDWRPVEERVK